MRIDRQACRFKIVQRFEVGQSPEEVGKQAAKRYRPILWPGGLSTIQIDVVKDIHYVPHGIVNASHFRCVRFTEVDVVPYNLPVCHHQRKMPTPIPMMLP